MRMCKDLTKDSSMEEITNELDELTAAISKIESTYIHAASLDPDYVTLAEYKRKAHFWMRMKVYR